MYFQIVRLTIIVRKGHLTHSTLNDASHAYVSRT